MRNTITPDRSQRECPVSPAGLQPPLLRATHITGTGAYEGDDAEAIFNSAVQATAYAVAAVCASRCMHTIFEMHPQSDRSHDGADVTVRPKRYGSAHPRHVRAAQARSRFAQATQACALRVMAKHD